jgi:hypothetical protein
MDKVTIFTNPIRFSHYQSYVLDEDNFYISIFKILGSNRKKIGLVSISSNISPFFILGKHYSGPDFEMKYIQFSSFFKNRINLNDYFG